MVDWAGITGSVLLFCLVFGMSATVDIGCMQAQLRNKKAILTGVFLQFIVLPFLGFLVVTVLNLSHAMGITLLVVTSSPGGSYSNWWCSMFNADLALSVTMTAISTLLSTVMLPVNLLVYTNLSYGDDVVGNLDWVSLFTSLVVVIGAIGLGLLASEKSNSHRFNMFANNLGNIAGIALVVFSAFMSNSDEDSRMWDREWQFYVGVASPCVLGLIIANIITTIIELAKPERVTASIECCYQNTGIATSVALTMFNGDELAEAMGVPFYYGIVEAAVLGIYCIIAWKAGWTKAPKDEPIWKVISVSYEVLYAETAELVQLETEGIEVVLKEEHMEEGDEKGITDDDHVWHYIHHDGAKQGRRRSSFFASSRTDSIVIAGTIQKRNPRKRERKSPSLSMAKLPSSTLEELRRTYKDSGRFADVP